MGLVSSDAVAETELPSETREVGFAEADAEPDGFGAEGFELEMPNWVEYWNCPVPVTIICKP